MLCSRSLVTMACLVSLFRKHPQPKRRQSRPATSENRQGSSVSQDDGLRDGIGVASIGVGDFDLDARCDQPFAPVGFPTIGDRVGELAAGGFGKAVSFAVGDEAEQVGFGEFSFGEQELDECGALCVEEFTESLVLRDGALPSEFWQREQSPLLGLLIEPLAQFGSSLGRFGEDGDAFVGPAWDLMLSRLLCGRLAPVG